MTTQLLKLNEANAGRLNGGKKLKKAIEVVEKHRLEAERAVDAILNFWSKEIICEALCALIDTHGCTEDFIEFIEDNFGESEPKCVDHVFKSVPGNSDFEKSLSQLEKFAPVSFNRDSDRDGKAEPFLAVNQTVFPSKNERLKFWIWKSAVVQRICGHPAMLAGSNSSLVPDFDSPQWETAFINGIAVDDAVERSVSGNFVDSR